MTTDTESEAGVVDARHLPLDQRFQCARAIRARNTHGETTRWRCKERRSRRISGRRRKCIHLGSDDDRQPPEPGVFDDARNVTMIW